MSDHPFSTDGKSDVPTSAGRKSWFREDIKRPLFPERRRDGEERSDRDYAEALRHFAREWVEYYIAYYERRAQRCRIGGITIRSIAFTAMVLGGVILVGRMLSRSNQEWVMGLFSQGTKTEVPAEIGLILFALAAGLMAADRFGNISENWMRYIIASLSLQRSLIDFQLAGVSSKQTQDSVDSNERLIDLDQQEFERIKHFLNSVFDLVQHETQEWADEFRKNRSDLEGYLKVQNAASKDVSNAKK